MFDKTDKECKLIYVNTNTMENILDDIFDYIFGFAIVALILGALGLGALAIKLDNNLKEKCITTDRSYIGGICMKVDK